MKTHFFGYYEMTPKQYEQLWRDCIFVVDANVLLDMYRMSPKAQDSLFQTLTALKDRLWIPYQVAYEYHKNVTTVILEQIKKCNEVIGDSNQWVNRIINGCQAKRNYPYLSEELQTRIKQVAFDIEQEIKQERQGLEKLISNNPTKDKIANLLEGRLWNKLSEERLNEIYREGKSRYELKTPPGYGDVKKKQGIDVYGDLVVWNEIIAYASANNKNVIFVTSDTNKEDWFIKAAEKILGPRAELRMEFAERTNNHVYYAYSTATFLQYVGNYIGLPRVSDKVIEEVASIIAEKTEADDSKTDSTQYNSGHTFSSGVLEQTDDSSSSES